MSPNLQCQGHIEVLSQQTTFVSLPHLCPFPCPGKSSSSYSARKCTLGTHLHITAQTTLYIKTVFTAQSNLAISHTLLKILLGFSGLHKPLIPCKRTYIPVAMNKPVERIFLYTCGAPDRMVCQQKRRSRQLQPALCSLTQL